MASTGFFGKSSFFFPKSSCISCRKRRGCAVFEKGPVLAFLHRSGSGGKNEQRNPKLPDFKGQGDLKGLGYIRVRLDSIRARFFNRNNLLKNVGPLKDSFVKKGKEKFYLGEKEPVKVAGVNIPGFEIFKE